MEINKDFWRICSACKRKQIPYSGKYYECSVSTCTGKRTGYVFCSVSCFETHLPGARHRDAWAIEKIAPTYAQALAEANPIINSSVNPSSNPSAALSSDQNHRDAISHSTTSHSSNRMMQTQEVLVVVSKMKQYIKDRADMNTSGDVADILSEQIRRACDEAIQNARSDGRKTVMARDFR